MLSSTSERMTKKGTENVGVQLDTLTLSRVKRQAERTFGTIQGAIQAYIRGATMKQLLADEQAEQGIIQAAEQRRE
jgi:hypothetical protein